MRINRHLRAKVPPPDARENKRTALVAIGNYAIAMLALASALFVLNATLLVTTSSNNYPLVLILGMIALAVSLYYGVRVLGRQITMLQESNIDPKDHDIKWRSLWQVLSLGAALVLPVIFALSNVRINSSSPSSPSSPSCSSSPSQNASTSRSPQPTDSPSPTSRPSVTPSEKED